jgi:hypothetical protein
MFWKERFTLGSEPDLYVIIAVQRINITATQLLLHRIWSNSIMLETVNTENTIKLYYIFWSVRFLSQ